MKLYLSLAIVATTISYMVYEKYKQSSNSHTTDFKQTSVQENKTLVSSSSRQPQNWEYNVFVSFRGADVRKGFLSHLLNGLKRKAIDPFIDTEMERGASISPELQRAIEGSRIKIVLLSENYASSSWCLDELVKILEYRKNLGHMVITIFYQVEPTDVKKQTGKFGKVFKRTCKGKTPEMTHKWKDALIEVATIAGYESSTWDDEAAAIENISTDISERLNHLAASQSLERFIGMKAHMDEMQSLIRFDLVDEVRIIGIWGPPGIGKSTICRCLFNLCSNNFRHKAIMVNIKKSYPNPCLDEGSAQLKLQNDILSMLSNNKNIVITHLGAAQDRLKDKEVFLVLDDVDQLAQLRAIAEDSQCFGYGSRIIIATEDLRVLLAYGIGIDRIYKVNYPSTDEAFQMFCMYAFGQKLPFDGFTELAREVTYHAGNLPLGLKVMGSYFRGMPKNEWKEALPKLRSRLDGNIESILKFSYDALGHGYKDLFCRIVCYYHFDRVDNLEAYLSESSTDVRHGLRVLAEKSFISFEDGYIIMHKLVAQLGQEIVRKQYGKSQFVIGAKNACEDYTTITSSVVGIAYTNTISERVFEEMFNQSTRLLSNKKIKRSTSYTDPPYLLSDSGRFIEISPKIQFLPMTCWPIAAKLENLFSKLKKLWEEIKVSTVVKLENLSIKLKKLSEEIKPIPHLESMDLRYSGNLKELLDFSTATSLEKLNIRNCSSLVKIPSSIGNATNIRCCSSLGYLESLRRFKDGFWVSSSLINDDFFLESLRRFKDDGFLESLFRFLDDGFWEWFCRLNDDGLLESLRKDDGFWESLRRFIYFDRCVSELPSLIKPPFSIRNENNLQVLNLLGCTNLLELPSSIGNAINLQKLNLYGCSSLKKLPYSIGNATNLQNLNLTGCSSLVELPYSIGNITNLEKLYLSHCSSLVKLPSSIGNLPKLKRLTLRGCSNLKALPTNINLEQIDIIDLTDHFVLKKFPDFFQLNRFRRNTKALTYG